MVWLLVLHIAALLMWCASLMYLPVLMIAAPQSRASFSGASEHLPTIERFVFTHVATPFALLAIAAGTLVFFFDGNTEPWLIVKLSLVVGLVVTHAFTGLLIVNAERANLQKPNQNGSVDPQRRFRYSNYALLISQSGLIATTFWVVLAKPGLEWTQ